jgi:hypothetical protein
MFLWWVVAVAAEVVIVAVAAVEVLRKSQASPSARELITASPSVVAGVVVPRALVVTAPPVIRRVSS